MSLLKRLEKMDRGRFAQRADLALSNVLDGVLRTGGDGEVSIKIKLQRKSLDGVPEIVMTAEVKQKVPTADVAQETAFVMGVDGDGPLYLSRRDPNQPTLEESAERARDAIRIVENGGEEPQSRVAGA